MDFLRHLRAVALLPGVVTIVVPAAIVYLTGADVGWGLSRPLDIVPLVIGGGLVALGLGLMASSIWLFALVGRGTLAPWDPTQQLVVRGIYRHVRNPMISGVFVLLLGEASLLGSLPLLVWFLLFTSGNALYIPLVEERGLERRFGDEYLRYKRNVPRWVPRVRPWYPS